MEYAKNLQLHNIAIWDAIPLPTTKLSGLSLETMYCVLT